jgi:hypothetical protein
VVEKINKCRRSPGENSTFFISEVTHRGIKRSRLYSNVFLPNATSYRNGTIEKSLEMSPPENNTAFYISKIG